MKQDSLILGLRSLAEGLNQIADALTEETETAPEAEKEASAKDESQKAKEPTEQAETAASATVEKTYSYEEVRGLLGKIAHDGHRDEIKALVLRHGGNSIKSYKDQPDILAMLVKEAEELSHAD